MERIIFRLFLLLCLAPSWALAFTPPIGIPTPPFPSDLDVATPSKPSPWTSEQAGYYYVERSDGGCSDSRTYGYPGTARCTLPLAPAAGAKVFLHGTYATGPTIAWANGTPSNPVWLIGYDNTAKPQFTVEYGISGSNIIVESTRGNFNMQGGFGISGDNILIRNYDHQNAYYANYSGVFFSSGARNCVLYKATIGPQAIWNKAGAGSVDAHATQVGAGADNIWILDSTMFHIQGDGTQVNSGDGNEATTHHIYIGRNLAYENYQSGFWTKGATDVIMSQNTVWGMFMNDDASNVGQAIGGQYDPRYVWFIANKLYNSQVGISASGPSSGGGGPWYAIGNVIYNILAIQSCNNYATGGIIYRNDGGMTAVFNTFDNVDTFFSAPVGGTITARNNILKSKQGTCAATQVDITFTHDYNLFSSASYDPGSEVHRVVGDPLLNADRSLQSNSLAINAANPTEEAVFATFQARYGIDIRSDFLGNDRPASATDWDLGAYEYGAVSGTTPTLTSPLNLTVSRPVTFEWEVFTGALKYEIQVDDNSDFSSPEVDVEIDCLGLCDETDTTYETAAEDLAPSTTYYWHVRALTN